MIKGRLADVRQLLNGHYNHVNRKYTDRRCTLLQTAASEGYYDIVKELLNHQADVNVQNLFGDTALMCASYGGHREIVKELLSHHADVNVQSNYGNTALHKTLMREINDTRIGIVKLLLSEGADVEKVNRDNKSVTHLAENSQNHSIVNLLEESKIEKRRKELQVLEVNQIIKSRKNKLQEINSSNKILFQLHKGIRTEEEKLKELEEKSNSILEEIACRKVKINDLKTNFEEKPEHKEFRLHEKLKEDIKYFEICIQEENYYDIIQFARKECPTCFEKIRSKSKIYQCEKGHVMCEECFDTISKESKICPFCQTDIVKDPRRNRALERLIKEEEDNKSTKSSYMVIAFLVLTFVHAIILQYLFSNK